MNISYYHDAARTQFLQLDKAEQNRLMEQFIYENPKASHSPGNETFLTWFYFEYLYFKADLTFNFLSVVHPVRDIAISGFRRNGDTTLECPEEEAEIFRVYAVQSNGEKHDFATSTSPLTAYRLKLLMLEIAKKWDIKLFQGYIDSFNYKTICNHDLELITAEIMDNTTPIELKKQQITANASLGEFANSIEVFNDDEYKLYQAMIKANL